MAAPIATYHSRNQQCSDYYKCTEDHFEDFVRIYVEHFSSSRDYGDLICIVSDQYLNRSPCVRALWIDH